MEEQLYLFFAIYLLLRRVGVTNALTVAFVVSAASPWIGKLWFVGAGYEKIENAADGLWLHRGPVTRTPFYHWFAWVLGAVAAEAYTGAISLPRWCSSKRIAVFVAAVALVTNSAMTIIIVPQGRLAGLLGVSDLSPYLEFLQFLSGLLFPAAVFVWLNCWLRAEKVGWFQGRFAKGLGVVGVMSYSLYLLHFPLIRVTDEFLPQDRTLSASLFRLAVQIPVCLVCACLFFWLVERRFLVRRASPADVPASQLALRQSAALATPPDCGSQRTLSNTSVCTEIEETPRKCR